MAHGKATRLKFVARRLALLLFAASLARAQSLMSVSCSGSAPVQGGMAYQTVCTASGGTPPYGWTSKALPAGLTLSAAAGATIAVSGSVEYNPLNPDLSYEIIVSDSSIPAPQQTVLPFDPNMVQPFPACSLIGSSLSPGNYDNWLRTPNFSPAGGSSIVNVTTYTGCEWSAGSDVSWITLSGATSGGLVPTLMGIPFSVAANPGSTPRTGHVIVSYGASSESLPVVQNGSSCSDTVNPQSASVPAAGGSVSFSVTSSPSGCVPLYTVDPNWTVFPIGVAPNYTLTIPANTGGSRTSTLTFGGGGSLPVATFTVSQAGPVPLDLSCSQFTGADVVGRAYPEAVCQVTGNSPPFYWSIASGAPPAGASLSPSTGVAVTVSGVISAAGPFAYEVQVTDSAVPPRTASYKFQGIAAAPLQVSCPGSGGTYPPNTAFTVTCTASGGAAPYTWSVSQGYSIASSGATATVSGNTGAAGIIYYFVDVTDASGQTGGVIADPLIVGPPQPLQVNCPQLPPGIAGTQLAMGCTAVNGVPPYTWSTAGVLPPGTYFAGDLVLQGFLTATGPYNFTVYATDSSTPPQTASATVSGTITSAAYVTEDCSVSAPQLGAPYSGACTGGYGTPPYTWSVSAGSLPAGLSLSPNGLNVNLTGTATVAGPYSFAIRIQDSSSPTPLTATQGFSGTIANAGMSIACASVVGPTAMGAAYSNTCTVTGGTAPHAWLILGGSLPPGVAWTEGSDTSIVISGTPTVPGAYAYTVRATDASHPILGASQAFSGTIAASSLTPPPTVVAVVSAANFQSGPISPGEIITIGGSALGPATPATLTLDATGKVSTSLGGVQVSIGGVLAPLTYVSATQINCVVPYEAATSPNLFAQVNYQGQASAWFPLTAALAEPALFTANGSGFGPVAALNQDGSYNSPGHPAPKGSIVTLFMTGEGMTGYAVTGAVTTVAAVQPYTPPPLEPVSVLIGGQAVQVQFAGEAPGVVAGLMQFECHDPRQRRIGQPTYIGFSGWD